MKNFEHIDSLLYSTLDNSEEYDENSDKILKNRMKYNLKSPKNVPLWWIPEAVTILLASAVFLAAVMFVDKTVIKYIMLSLGILSVISSTVFTWLCIKLFNIKGENV